MMIVAGEECLARRRAERGCVALGIAQAFLRERIQRLHVNAAAESAGRTETDIIEQNHDDVGRTLGWPEWLDRRKLRIARVQRNLAKIFVLRIWNRQLSAIDLLSVGGKHPRDDAQI